MSERVKVFIQTQSQEKVFKLKDIIAPYPEFELVTKGGQILSSALLAKRISNIFITVGIPAHIKGYQFLREAVKLAIERPDIINSITKELYPNIATYFDTTPSKVERAIRHAIEVGWARGKLENFNDLFEVKVYDKNDRPTNGEFIALIADKLIVEGLE